MRLSLPPGDASKPYPPAASPNGRKRPLTLLVPAMVLALSACADPAEPRRALCRDLVQALDSDAGLAVVMAEPRPATGDEVEITYRLDAGAGPELRQIRCRFAPGGWLERPRLSRVIDRHGRPLGPAAMFFLEANWLGRAAARDGVAPAAVPDGAMLAQQLINAVGVGSAYALLAIAFSLVYALVGRIHLALGDLAMLGALVATSLLVAVAGLLPLWALPLALLLAAATATLPSGLLAALTGAGALARLWHSTGHAPLIAALGLSLAIREGARLAQGNNEPWLPPLLGEPLELLEIEGFAVTVTMRQFLVLAMTMGLWAGIAFLLARTRLGQAIRAMADDPLMTALLGVDTLKVMRHTLGLAGMAAALAGTILLLAWGMVGIEGGFILGLKALAAAILGGIGSVHGAVLGGFLIGTIETLWTAYLDSGWRDTASFLILTTLLVLRPSGLLGRQQPHPNDRFRPKE